MTVISSQEFAANQQKYFDMARERKEVHLRVRNGENMFSVGIENDSGRKYLEPDDDFRRAISAEEFRERLVEMVKELDKKYAKNASNHPA